MEFGTLNSLQKKLKEKSESLVNSQKNGEATLLRQEVTFDDIAEVVSKWTSIPVQNLNQSEKDKLLSLESILKKISLVKIVQLELLQIPLRDQGLV